MEGTNMGFEGEYFDRADEVIGQRTSGEIKYDAEVLKWLRRGRSIRDAIKKANRHFPDEALKVSTENEADVEEHYRFQLQHEDIIGKLNGL